MNNSKKAFMFLFSVVILLAAVSAVDAALCKGFDGYYHDCGYNYGINSYGRDSSRGYQSNYGHGQNVAYLNSGKKYNPINNYYIYGGQGYERTYRDDNRYDNRNVNVRYIRDERTYENRYPTQNNGRQLKVYIDNNQPQNYNNYGKTGNEYHVVRLGADPEWYDSDPYHDIKLKRNIRSWKLTGEEHCPDGFVCADGKWY